MDLGKGVGVLMLCLLRRPPKFLIIKAFVPVFACVRPSPELAARCCVPARYTDTF